MTCNDGSLPLMHSRLIVGSQPLKDICNHCLNSIARIITADSWDPSNAMKTFPLRLHFLMDLLSQRIRTISITGNYERIGNNLIEVQIWNYLRQSEKCMRRQCAYTRPAPGARCPWCVWAEGSAVGVSDGQFTLGRDNGHITCIFPFYYMQNYSV